MGRERLLSLTVFKNCTMAEPSVFCLNKQSLLRAVYTTPTIFSVLFSFSNVGNHRSRQMITQPSSINHSSMRSSFDFKPNPSSDIICHSTNGGPMSLIFCPVGLYESFRLCSLPSSVVRKRNPEFTSHPFTCIKKICSVSNRLKGRKLQSATNID